MDEWIDDSLEKEEHSCRSHPSPQKPVRFFFEPTPFQQNTGRVLKKYLDDSKLKN